MKENDDDVGSDFNHHDIIAKDIGIFVFTFIVMDLFVCFAL